jgi:hypothetical protein
MSMDARPLRATISPPSDFEKLRWPSARSVTSTRIARGLYRRTVLFRREWSFGSANGFTPSFRGPGGAGSR